MTGHNEYRLLIRAKMSRGDGETDYIGPTEGEDEASFLESIAEIAVMSESFIAFDSIEDLSGGELLELSEIVKKSMQRMRKERKNKQ